jgi:Zn-dependent protease
VDLYLHWSWFLVALLEINWRAGSYSSLTWNVLEYLALFFIVGLHEYGHALACRQVGGRADHIVLWPLGGVAYVNPPPRPGATLWSIAAGPLVNVALIPTFLIVGYFSRSLGWNVAAPNAHALLRAATYINFGLLVFNMLPIYPLDGGQILRSLLWFVVGRARSLMVATVIGFIGVVGFIGLALLTRSVPLGAIAAFMLLNCWAGLQHARALTRLAKLPRREGFVCPMCQTAPPVGALWVCGQCRNAFDTFQTQAACPYCATQYPVTKCLECGELSPMREWAAQPSVAPPLYR